MILYTRIVVGDAVPVVLHGLTSIIETIPSHRVVAAVADGGECLRTIQKLEPDIAMIATEMPSLSGWQILSAVVAASLPTRIILTTVDRRRRDGLIALNAGAYALIPQQSAPEALQACIAAVQAGRQWLPPPLEATPLFGGTERIPENGDLTRREREVAALAAQGLSNKAIARRLNLSDGTVRIHLQSIFKKLGVANRTELAIQAIDFGVRHAPIPNEA